MSLFLTLKIPALYFILPALILGISHCLLFTQESWNRR